MRVGIIGVLVGLLLAGCSGGDKSASGGGEGSKGEIVIVWAQWQPADAMRTLVEGFTKETGISVKVEQIPWPQFGEKVRTAIWAGKSTEYDIVIGDSQWIGQGATEGHYVDLTDWLKQNVKVEDITPSALAAYCEYPAGSKKYFAIPCESDGIGFAYRKDKFDDPKEQAAFQAKYGRKLEVPKTWSDLKQVAEFFTRPAQQEFGAALFYAKEYDGATMGFQQVMWCWGGDWATGAGDPEGAANSADSIAALEFYRGLKAYCPLGSETYYFTETGRAFNSGKVAMAMQWFAFMPDFADKSKNKFADVTGYFVSPGEKKHYVSMGGQGMSLSAYSKKQDQAKQFMAWFSKEETQKEWAKLGGYTANAKVLASSEFKQAKPYNEAFSQTVPLLKDFTNNPKYQQMLDISQEKLSAAITGQLSAKAALDQIAAKDREILVEAGLLK